MGEKRNGNFLKLETAEQKTMADPFHIRFNIDLAIEEARRRFVNRVENRVLNIAKALHKAGKANSFNALEALIIEIETALGESHLTDVSGPGVFIAVWRERIDSDFSRCLQAVEGLREGLSSYGANLLQKVDLAVSETLTQSEVDLGVSWQSGIFAKTGAESLDGPLVNQPLLWLANPKYVNVLIPFKKGLSHFLEGGKDSERFGDTVTDMYEAVEAMARITTGKSSKDLSSLREEFVSTLRLPESYKRMLKEYVDYGCDFRHAVEGGQKRGWPLEKEAEAFVYLTGLFIRLAIQTDSLVGG